MCDSSPGSRLLPFVFLMSEVPLYVGLQSRLSSPALPGKCRARECLPHTTLEETQGQNQWFLKSAPVQIPTKSGDICKD